tara:strand:- start:2465 stop:2872 length:408 start_codon:yes stop_codon:yes gene_type:complete
MEFNINELNPSDYDEVLVNWWKEWGWTPPPKEFLPEDGQGGIMVLYKDKPVCAGFVYFTNSKVSWVEWIISDKNVDKKLRHDAVKHLIGLLTSICQEQGSKFVYAILKNDNLMKTYEEWGYVQGDVNCNEMIKKI